MWHRILITSGFIFAVLGLVAVGYIRALVQETAGESLEDVAEQLRSRYPES